MNVHIGYDSVFPYIFFRADGTRLAHADSYEEMREVRQDLESQGYIVADY